MSPAFALLLCSFNTVSFEADSTTVKNLLKEVSRQSGVALRCDAATGAEVLIVDFKNQPVESVLPRIASLAAGEWKERSDARVLERTAKATREETAQERERTANAITRLQQDLADRAAKLSKFDSAQAEQLTDEKRVQGLEAAGFQSEYARLGEINPLARAASRLFCVLPAGALADMKQGRRVVLSDKPNPMQRNLPMKLDELITDVKLFEAASSKAGGKTVRWGSVPTLGPGSLAAGYEKSLFALTRTGSLSFHYQVRLVDTAGYSIASVEGDFPNRTLQLGSTYAHKGSPLPLSDLTKEFCRMSGTIGASVGMSMPVKLPDGTESFVSESISMAEATDFMPSSELLKVLRTPAVVDPAGVVLGPSLRSIAAARGESLLASVSDGTVTAAMQAIDRKAIRTDQDLLDLLQQTAVPAHARAPYASIDEGNGWMVVRPFAPIAARAARFDREGLQKLIGELVRTYGISLQSAAQYVSLGKRLPGFGSLDLMILNTIEESAWWGTTSRLFRPGLSILSSLSQGQWAAVHQGPLLWAQLSDEQRAMIEDYIFSNRDFLFELERSNMPWDRRVLVKNLEPTELFPTGVPVGAKLFLDESAEDAAVVQAKSGRRYLFNLVSLVHHEQYGGKFQAMNATITREYTAFMPCTIASYTLRLEPASELTSKLPVSAVDVPGGPWLSRDQFQKVMGSKLEMARKAVIGR